MSDIPLALTMCVVVSYTIDWTLPRAIHVGQY